MTQITQAVAIFFGIANGLCSLTQSLPLMILCMALIGCFEGMNWVNLPLLAIEATSGEHVDEAYGIIMTVTGFVELAGPPLMGKYLTSATQVAISGRDSTRGKQGGGYNPSSANLRPPVGEKWTIYPGNSSRKLVFLTIKKCKK